MKEFFAYSITPEPLTGKAHLGKMEPLFPLLTGSHPTLVQ